MHDAGERHHIGTALGSLLPHGVENVEGLAGLTKLRQAIDDDVESGGVWTNFCSLHELKVRQGFGILTTALVCRQDDVVSH